MLIRDVLDLQSAWRANVRQHTKKAAADLGLRYWPRSGDHRAHGFRSTALTLLNEEGAFDGDVVEVQLAHDTEKEAPTARRGGEALAWQV